METLACPLALRRRGPYYKPEGEHWPPRAPRGTWHVLDLVSVGNLAFVVMLRIFVLDLASTLIRCPASETTFRVSAGLGARGRAGRRPFESRGLCW
ncbi:hypothetical protein HPB50_003127 [Hyalomma asiaticum]|uniref:Uncharacterized protein n=1 Tax=Hyalomma asiaticum TaxID=266040 RepID=A0ACB7RS98_HYAAI|nr:hypothetical protein HPB50_003127 [Hyalomma asiaticum]